MSEMIRFTHDVKADLTASLGSTPAIEIGQFASGAIFVPVAATLTYYVAPRSGGTYVPAGDAAGAAIVQTLAAGGGFPIPAGVFGAALIKIVAAAPVTVDISLKS